MGFVGSLAGKVKVHFIKVDIPPLCILKTYSKIKDLHQCKKRFVMCFK